MLKHIWWSVLAALILTACFTSQKSLIGYWNADTPLKPGLYAHWPVSPDGEEWVYETWRGQIKRTRKHYISTDEGFAHQHVRLHKLQDDIYLAQLPRDDGVGYGIAWIYEDGYVLSYHNPDCGVLSDDVLSKYSVALDKEGFCQIDNLEQLEAVIRVYLDHIGSDIRIDGVYRRVD